MKIGMNMHLWSTCITREHFGAIEELKTLGYDGIEVFLASPERTHYEEVGRFASSIGLAVNGCLGMGADQNLISPDATIRQAGLEKIKEAIDNIHAAGGTSICGPFHSAFATFSRDEPRQEEYVRSAEMLRLAGDHAAAAGVTLFPEALNRFECYLCNTMAQLRKLIDLVDHPNVRGMFDTHHANIEEKSYADAITTIAPVLGHVHLSENDRGTPGSGHVPWDETFATLARIGYDGWLTIEAFSRDDVEFANAINVWRTYDERAEICARGIAFVREKITRHFTT